MSTARSQPLAGFALRPHLEAILTVLAAIGLVITAVLAGQSSAVGLLVIGIALAVLLAAASLRWPQVVIVLVVLTPILDRYIISGWLPPNVAALSHLLSEAMLLTVGAAIGVQAWRRGRLLPALRHPTSLGLAAFVTLMVVSGLANAVPPQVAGAGLAFTLDAAALFYLPRMAGFTLRQSLRAVGVILALVAVAAVAGLSQWILAPDFLGFHAWQGAYGEAYRLAAIFTDPNTFGALLIAAIPFAAFGITSLRRPGHRLVALVGLVLLFMPLYLSYSRGAWGGLLVGGFLVLGIISWRTLAITIAIAIISLMMALTLPKTILVPPPPPPENPTAPPPPRSWIDSTIARISEIWAGRDLRTQFVINGLPILADHPLLGVGPGRYGGAAADVFGTPVYEEYGTTALFTDPQQRTVDNFWWHLLVESGILGLVAYVSAALLALVPIIRLARRSLGWHRFLLGGIGAGTAAMALNAFTTMLLEANSVAFVIWLLLGLGSLVVAARASEEQRPLEDPARDVATSAG